VPVIVDNKTVYKSWKEVPLKPEEIKEINVLKGEYINKGLDVSSKEGVILITTKNGEVNRYEPIFDKVDSEAWVDKEEWQKFLGANLQPIIENVAKKGAAPGQYTTLIRFLVQKDGKLSDFMVVKDPGYDLGNACLELLMKGSPEWHPAEQNGKKVNSYHTQPITFVIAEE
jgi:protein TonB